MHLDRCTSPLAEHASNHAGEYHSREIEPRGSLPLALAQRFFRWWPTCLATLALANTVSFAVAASESSNPSRSLISCILLSTASETGGGVTAYVRSRRKPTCER
jgi:hypothetical protein